MSNLQFGPDAPLSNLPVEFRACLPPNTLSPAQQASCDTAVGSMASGIGYCSEAPYNTMTYCACVNNAIPCPMIAAAACVNSAFSYRPSDMLAPNGQSYLDCKGTPICVNIVEVGGSQNVVSGITQECGVIQNITNVISTNPPLAVLAIILFIMLVILLSMRSEDGGGGSGRGGRGRPLPPPPPPNIFGDTNKT